MLGLWRYARALVITLVLFLSFVAGWPARIPKLVKAWPKPLAELALELPALQAKLLAPFAPLADALGITSQDWPLFTGTGGIRYRMWVEGQSRKSRSWKLLYRAHDDEHDYLAGTLEYRRVLNLWNPHHSWISDGYPDFSRWVARRVLEEHPRFRAARVRMEEVEIRAGAEGFEPTGRFVYEMTLDRDEVARD